MTAVDPNRRPTRMECLEACERVDHVPGQITVEFDGRVFAVIRGRRWTRVPEYMTNGQLTARWFVDEATGEVRQADGWKSPKSWPIGGDGAQFVLAIVAKARESR